MPNSSKVKVHLLVFNMSRRSRNGDAKKGTKALSETVVAVFPEGKAGVKALKALESAIDRKSSSIESIPFQQLDFGDLKALEKFYSAPVVVVDVTERQYEACLYYQIGLRESFGMKHNVVMCVDDESNYSAAGKKISDQSALGVSECINYMMNYKCHFSPSWLVDLHTFTSHTTWTKMAMHLLERGVIHIQPK